MTGTSSDIHQTVVRLKGGDPSVFGRVGEEAAFLERYQVPFEIIPGITSGIAVPAYANVPVTHRTKGTSFAVATGHSQKENSLELDWSGLAKIDTVAFYMGVKKIFRELLRTLFNMVVLKVKASYAFNGERRASKKW